MLTSEIRNLTPEEVDARLPLLVRIADDLVEAWTERRLLRDRRRRAGRGNPGAKEETGISVRDAGPSLDLAAREEERRLTEQLTQLTKEVEQLGGMTLDPSTGTLEFPSLLDGTLVLLSWRIGEDRVRYYRTLDAPRGERQLLPGMTAPEGAEEAASGDGDAQEDCTPESTL